MRRPGLLLLISLGGCSAIDDFGGFHFTDGGGAAGDAASVPPDMAMTVADAAPPDLMPPPMDGAVAPDLLMGPTAQINHPGDGETRTAGMAIPFIGVANDPRDGALTGNALVWTDSLEGQIGTGNMFSATLFQKGMHTVTLTATDSIGLKGTDTVMLTLN